MGDVSCKRSILWVRDMSHATRPPPLPGRQKHVVATGSISLLGAGDEGRGDTWKSLPKGAA